MAQRVDDICKCQAPRDLTAWPYGKHDHFAPSSTAMCRTDGSPDRVTLLSCDITCFNVNSAAMLAVEEREWNTRGRVSVSETFHSISLLQLM